MLFKNAQVKSVKADLAKKEITITLVVDMGAQPEAEELARYADPDAGQVMADITPRQMAMRDFSVTMTRKPRADPETGEIDE